MHYPDDSATAAIEAQFFYGPSLLVSPVTQQDSTSVSFYLPQDTFYDFFTLKKVSGSGSSITYSNVSTSDIPVHIKGGSIIAARVNGANTTTALRDVDFELLVAPDGDGNASGSLYLDDGESVEQSGTSEIEFSFDGTTIKMHGSFGFSTMVGVTSLTVLGDGDAVKYELDEGLDGPWSHDVGSLEQVDL